MSDDLESYIDSLLSKGATAEEIIEVTDLVTDVAIDVLSEEVAVAFGELDAETNAEIDRLLGE